MAPYMSKPAGTASSNNNKDLLLKFQLQSNPPAILFHNKKAKAKVGEGEETDQRVFNVPLDNSTAGSKEDKKYYKHYMACFEEGTPEEWCALRTEAADLFIAMGIEKETDQQHNIWRSLFKGLAKDRFTALYNQTKVENDSKPTEKQMTSGQMLKVVLNGMAKVIFADWQHAVRNQK